MEDNWFEKNKCKYQKYVRVESTINNIVAILIGTIEIVIQLNVMCNSCVTFEIYFKLILIIGIEIVIQSNVVMYNSCVTFKICFKLFIYRSENTPRRCTRWYRIKAAKKS